VLWTAISLSGSASVEFAVLALAGDTGSGSVELVVSELAATGLIDCTGTGDVALPGSGLAESGSLLIVGLGDVSAEFALAGGAELADTASGFRHFEHTSTFERVLVF
jgi:hypothetical protein